MQEIRENNQKIRAKVLEMKQPSESVPFTIQAFISHFESQAALRQKDLDAYVQSYEKNQQFKSEMQKEFGGLDSMSEEASKEFQAFYKRMREQLNADLLRIK